MSKIYKFFNQLQTRWFAGWHRLAIWWVQFVTVMRQCIESGSEEEQIIGIIMFIISFSLIWLLMLSFLLVLVTLAKEGFFSF